MVIKPLRAAAFAAVLVTALALAASRIGGAALELPSGKVVGYSKASGEWLFAEYPSEPLRRDGPYVLLGEAGRYTLTLEPQADGTTAVMRSRTGDEVEVVADGGFDAVAQLLPPPQRGGGSGWGCARRAQATVLRTPIPTFPRVAGEGAEHVAGEGAEHSTAKRTERGAGEGAAPCQANESTAPIRFRVPLRKQHPRAPTQWPMPRKLLAVSDLEGEFSAAVRLLRAQGVIGDRLQWTYGDGHLVLIGDMVDRGVDVVPLLWLIYKLEAEAKTAGGAVHYVLGNHERYVLQGRAKSAHPKHLATSRATGFTYGELWSAQSELGRWLRSKPVMVRIGDTLFAHGGVSADVLALAPDLATIDAAAARYANAARRHDDVSGAVLVNGLMSDRSLATPAGSNVAIEHLAQLLQHFGASRIVIGHTSVPHVGYTHGGRIMRTNVAHARGVNEAISWSDSRWWRCDARGQRVPLGTTVTGRKR